MKLLDTGRLKLRTCKLSDAEDFYSYARLPGVGPNAGWKPHESKEQSIEILKAFLKEREVWGVIHKRDRRFIGTVGIHRDKKRPFEAARMLGYAFSPEYWGNGYATEAARRVIRFAFEEMDLEVLSISHFPFNQRSCRVIEKCGFRYEGTLRKSAVLHDGSVCDEVCYSLLKEEYQRNKETYYPGGVK